MVRTKPNLVALVILLIGAAVPVVAGGQPREQLFQPIVLHRAPKNLNYILQLYVKMPNTDFAVKEPGELILLKKSIKPTPIKAPARALVKVASLPAVASSPVSMVLGSTEELAAPPAHPTNVAMTFHDYQAARSAVGNTLPSVDAVDTDLAVVMRTLAVLTGKNIVVGQDAQAKVTAHIKSQPLPDILTQITKSNGLTWRKEGDTYLVTKLDPAAETASQKEADLQSMVTQVWRCQYNTQEALAGVVQKVFPAITVAAGPVNALPTLDSSASAATGSAIASGTQDTSLTSLQPGILVLHGQKSDVDQAMVLIKQIDIRRPQVVIEALVSELSNDASKDLGFTWNWSSVNISETPDSFRFGKFTRGNWAFEGILEALQKDGKAKLLAKPSLAVVDGGRGSILIGDRILFPKLIGYSQTGTPIYDKEEEKVGIYLQIAPIVSDDGYITMTVYPQVSLVKGYLKTQAGDYPQISTREAKTTIRLREGEKFAIGGLMQDEDIDRVTKVPILGDLPILKALFSHRSKSSTRTEIVIFLTPRIISGEDIQATASSDIAVNKSANEASR